MIRVSNKHQNAPYEDISLESMIDPILESTTKPSKIRPLRWGKRFGKDWGKRSFEDMKASKLYRTLNF